jgi:hypothetical protein
MYSGPVRSSTNLQITATKCAIIWSNGRNASKIGPSTNPTRVPFRAECGLSMLSLPMVARCMSAALTGYARSGHGEAPRLVSTLAQERSTATRSTRHRLLQLVLGDIWDVRIPFSRLNLLFRRVILRTSTASIHRRCLTQTVLNHIDLAIEALRRSYPSHLVLMGPAPGDVV